MDAAPDAWHLVALALLAVIVLVMIWLIPRVWRCLGRVFGGLARSVGTRPRDSAR